MQSLLRLLVVRVVCVQEQDEEDGRQGKIEPYNQDWYGGIYSHHPDKRHRSKQGPDDVAYHDNLHLTPFSRPISEQGCECPSDEHRAYNPPRYRVEEWPTSRGNYILRTQEE